MGDQISDGVCDCVCQFIACMCMCSMRVRARVCHLYCVCVCTACLCPLCETGTCFPLVLQVRFSWACVCVCPSARLQVKLRCSAVCWCMALYGKCVVWLCLCVSGQTLGLDCESLNAQLASTGDVAQSTRCTFPVVNLWYSLLSVWFLSSVCNFFLHAVFGCFTGTLFCVKWGIIILFSACLLVSTV